MKTLKKEDMLTTEQFKEKFKEYLQEELFFDYSMAEYLCMDMGDPYEAQFIRQEFEGDCVFDDITYQVRECCTDFCMIGMFHLADAEPFKFYMLINKGTLKGKTVGDYINAEKMYVVS